MIFIQGQRVVIPDGRVGIVTATSEGSIGELLIHVYTDDGEVMKSFFPEELREARNNQVTFSVGDEVVMIDEDPIQAIGVITNWVNGKYTVKWEYQYGEPSDMWTRRFSNTSEWGKDLLAYRRLPDPKFSVGQRVFFHRAAPDRFPLGVITRVAARFNKWDEPTGFYNAVVAWDNGVDSTHDFIELGSVDEAIQALSRPIP